MAEVRTLMPGAGPMDVSSYMKCAPAIVEIIATVVSVQNTAGVYDLVVYLHTIDGDLLSIVEDHELVDKYIETMGLQPNHV